MPPPPRFLVFKYQNPARYSNTIYYTKYKSVGLDGLRNTLCRCTEVNNDLNTQLSIIICDVLTPNVACRVLETFKDGGTKSTIQM